MALMAGSMTLFFFFFLQKQGDFLLIFWIGCGTATEQLTPLSDSTRGS